MFCTKCGAQLVDGARFCSKCGAEAAGSQSVCPNCGRSLTEGQRFCEGCGTHVAAAAAMAVATADSTPPDVSADAVVADEPEVPVEAATDGAPEAADAASGGADAHEDAVEQPTDTRAADSVLASDGALESSIASDETAVLPEGLVDVADAEDTVSDPLGADGEDDIEESAWKVVAADDIPAPSDPTQNTVSGFSPSWITLFL